MLHIKKTTVKDLKQLKEEAEELRRKEYMEKFGPIRKHLIDEQMIDRELDDFY